MLKLDVIENECSSLTLLEVLDHQVSEKFLVFLFWKSLTHPGISNVPGVTSSPSGRR